MENILVLYVKIVKNNDYRTANNSIFPCQSDHNHGKYKPISDKWKKYKKYVKSKILWEYKGK